jgi:hypothetical protein
VSTLLPVSRWTGACATFGTGCMHRDGVTQNRLPPRLMGCFVPRHLNSPRLAISSLSSSLRSCPSAFALLFGRAGESESDEEAFEGTPLRATEAGMRDPGTDEAGLLVRDVGLLGATVAAERWMPFPFRGCLREGTRILSSSSFSDSVDEVPVVAWPRTSVPGPCRAAIAFVEEPTPDPIFFAC